MDKLKKAIKILAVLLIALIIFFKIEEIADCITSFKAKVFSVMENPENTENLSLTDVDFSVYTPLADEEGAWYCNNPIVAHAGGGYYGKTYTNCLEAMRLAVENGINVIEVDMVVTSDKQIILKHDWDEDEDGNDIVLSHKEFMSSAIERLYTPMDIYSLFELMNSYDELYIIVDVKAPLEVYELLAEAARDTDNLELMDRFIIQLYTRDSISQIKEIYPFPSLLYTLYVSGDRDFNAIAAFCLENDIHVITMPVGWAASYEDELKVFNEQNVHVYVHTVNDIQTVIDMNGRGISGFYSDWLRPEDLRKVGRLSD